MTESSTAAQTAASAESPTWPIVEPMTITISLSGAAPAGCLDTWQAVAERLANRISDEVFEAGGAIGISDCGRPWCVEKDFDGEGGEHARHHTGKVTHIGVRGAEYDRDTWHGYLLQEPGDVGLESTKAVFTNDARGEFEIPVWQLVVLQELIESDAGSQVWLLTEQAQGRELEL